MEDCLLPGDMEFDVLVALLLLMPGPTLEMELPTLETWWTASVGLVLVAIGGTGTLKGRWMEGWWGVVTAAMPEGEGLLESADGPCTCTCCFML